MTTVQKGVLCFDIGIKNLAWCITSLSGETISIVGWGNYNLLEDREAESAGPKAATCGHCAAKAKFTSVHGLSCQRHIPATAPLLKDASGVVFTKVPSAPELRAALSVKGIRPMPKTKDAMYTAVQAFSSVPVVKIKVPHAAAMDMAKLHDSLRRFVDTLVPFFPQISEVRLENQPVLKNPVMKTVQILLYATLRDRMISAAPVPPFKLVHAGMKVKGAAVGDTGYAARKKGSEDRAEAKLSTVVHSAHWLAFFKTHKKRSDLADAFCMCLDAYAGKHA